MRCESEFRDGTGTLVQISLDFSNLICHRIEASEPSPEVVADVVTPWILLVDLIGILLREENYFGTDTVKKDVDWFVRINSEQTILWLFEAFLKDLASKWCYTWLSKLVDMYVEIYQESAHGFVNDHIKLDDVSDSSNGITEESMKRLEERLSIVILYGELLLNRCFESTEPTEALGNWFDISPSSFANAFNGLSYKYIKFFLKFQASNSLFKNGAEYPPRILYSSPQYYSVEALEVHYLFVIPVDPNQMTRGCRMSQRDIPSRVLNEPPNANAQLPLHAPIHSSKSVPSLNSASMVIGHLVGASPGSHRFSSTRTRRALLIHAFSSVCAFRQEDEGHATTVNGHGHASYVCLSKSVSRSTHLRLDTSMASVSSHSVAGSRSGRQQFGGRARRTSSITSSSTPTTRRCPPERGSSFAVMSQTYRSTPVAASSSSTPSHILHNRTRVT
ncbi:hypothetical protein V9T40_008224 [Parthenolecanium corni]|uniref:Uncharacterized protein n=1 Tax=Parthenolecanium corni TaxID=536013 RepID=A0AAN9Y5R5_9HEMI